jgi:hypothetical protein
MVSWKLFLGGDLEDHLNVGENLIRFQDVTLQKNIKLIRDFGLLFTHSLMLWIVSVVCDT